jgi:hypothetical protein
MDNNQAEDDLMYIYEWVDNIPLSKPKKNISRDFSDAVLLAEIVKYHIPRLVDIHNYPVTNSSTQKLYNWNTLNTKVFKKIGLNLSKGDIDSVLQYKPLAVESILKKLYEKIRIFTANNPNNEPLNNSNIENINNNVQQQSKQMGGVKRNQGQGQGQGQGGEKDEYFQRILEEKDNKIEELRVTLDILEMKLKNSDEIQSKLSNRVKDLTDKLRSLGVNP